MYAVFRADTADHLGEAIASALSSIADRFRGDAASMTDATKTGAAEAKVGHDALRRLSREVQRSEARRLEFFHKSIIGSRRGEPYPT
jgi:hypothetical protein